MVDSAALDAFAEKVTGANGVLASTARYVLNELGVTAPAAEPGEDENAAVVAAVDAELGSDWSKQVEPRFDSRKAILFDDRWASAREDLARLFYNGDQSVESLSFVGAGKDSPTRPSGSRPRAMDSSPTPSTASPPRPSNRSPTCLTHPASRTTSQW